MKRYVYVLALVVSFMSLVACSKNDPAPASPAVGRWELNRGLANGFPTSLTAVSGLNGQAIDLYWFDNEGATLDIYSDNSFNQNNRYLGVSDDTGTWDFTNNTLTLKYDSGQQDTYTYSKNKNIEELTEVKGQSYTLPVSTTAGTVGATGSIQWVFRK